MFLGTHRHDAERAQLLDERRELERAHPVEALEEPTVTFREYQGRRHQRRRIGEQAPEQHPGVAACSTP